MAKANAPLADQLRPKTISDVIGQPQLTGSDGALRAVIDGSAPLMSLLLWGPPGTGKTTIARLIAQRPGYVFIELSATQDGVKTMRQAFDEARKLKTLGQQAVVFIDELHRFSRSQQDALLPVVENGVIILIGATTEHPSFEINRALLSRLALFILSPLDDSSLNLLMMRALHHLEEEGDNYLINDDAKELLRDLSGGDGRRLISLIERAVQFANGRTISVDEIRASAGEKAARFDHQRDEFYDQISALHKAVRGSDPDAAIYWFARMLEGGADPLYLSRRLVRMASEDIGNADPRALELAVASDKAYRQLGSPEGELALAQTVLYLASTLKSNAAYKAFSNAQKAARQTMDLEVPKHLKAGSTAIDRKLGFGVNYRYSQEEPNAYSIGQHYFPDEFDAVLYEPSPFGVESKLAERIKALRASK